MSRPIGKKIEIDIETERVCFNPFTAPVCKISGPEDAWTHLKNSRFSGPITHLLSVIIMRLDENPSHDSAKKTAKRLKGCKFCTFISRFQMTSWQ